MSGQVTPEVEKVARAIARLAYRDGDVDALLLDKPRWHSFVPTAIAAIQALMEPSERMVNAIIAECGAGNFDTEWQRAVAAYRRALLKALSS
jgi:hypothetical protein